jgi:hypothetical protein
MKQTWLLDGQARNRQITGDPASDDHCPGQGDRGHRSVTGQIKREVRYRPDGRLENCNSKVKTAPILSWSCADGGRSRLRGRLTGVALGEARLI